MTSVSLHRRVIFVWLTYMCFPTNQVVVRGLLVVDTINGRGMHGSNKARNKSIPILTTNVCSTDAADASGAAAEKKKTMAMASTMAVAAALGRLCFRPSMLAMVAYFAL